MSGTMKKLAAAYAAEVIKKRRYPSQSLFLYR